MIAERRFTINPTIRLYKLSRMYDNDGLVVEMAHDVKVYINQSVSQ